MKRILLIAIVLSVWMWADGARYTRSDAGIVTDYRTGLQWQDDYSDNNDTIKSAKWTDAIAYCEALLLGGYSDWRLPNFNELFSIADRSRANPAIDDSVFLNTRLDYYWSSTTEVNYIDYAWFVKFDGGHGSNYAKSNSPYVRCVRAGE